MRCGQISRIFNLYYKILPVNFFANVKMIKICENEEISVLQNFANFAGKNRKIRNNHIANSSRNFVYETFRDYPKLRGLSSPKVGIRNLSPHLRNSAILRTIKLIAELRTKKGAELRLQTFKN